VAVLECPLERPVALPGAHELEADAGRDHYLHEPRAAARAVELEPPLEILGEAQVVPRVLVGALEMEQVFGRQAFYADLILDAGAGRRASGDWVGIKVPLGLEAASI
jgi:hypothetical protein